MLDPITAIAACTSAFQMTKKLVQHGREIEDVMGQLGEWFGAASDLSRAEQQRRTPSTIQKLTSGDSIEKEAFDIIVHKKKLAAQEKELMFMLNMRFGPSTWEEMVKLRRSIRKEREETVYKAMEAKQQIVNNIGMFVISSLILVTIFGGVYLIGKGAGSW
tara:strand:+ start:28059 stop:28541 length:483 start_codon:yes stop_codon:yes gene_type:complete